MGGGRRSGAAGDRRTGGRPPGRGREHLLDGLHVVAAAAATALLTAVLWSAARAAGVPVLPLGPQLLAWPVVMATRMDAVQRLLGGPDLDRRSVARQALACAQFTVALTAAGMPALVPVACGVVASVHAQWDARPSARAGAVLAVVLTSAAHALVLAGTVPTLLPAGTSALVAVVGLGLSTALSANLVLIARDRRAADDALARERAAREAGLLHAVDHDPLTGALGRRGLERRLAVERRGCLPAATAAVVLDLDGFKPVNDRHGHAVGDAVLVAVVERFRAALPEGSLLARTGGDEFVVVVHGVASGAAARSLGRRLEELLTAPVSALGLEVSVGVSAGAAWSQRPEPAEALLVRADDAMYAAKRARRAAGASASASAAADDHPGPGVPRQDAVLDRR